MDHEPILAVSVGELRTGEPGLPRGRTHGKAFGMTAEADDEQARKDARREQYQDLARARSRRTMAKFQIGLAVMWGTLAVVRWFDDDADPVTRWMFTGLGAAYVVFAAVLYWRVLRRPPA